MENELNQKLIETLNVAAKENRIANTYIFEGENEEQVLKIAEDFARKICSTEMDLQYLQQEKPELISVNDVRINICSDVSICPYGDGKKVYIVKNAERMNVAAQNALLKTLEEPPGYVSIFLLTKNKNVFLPTILSRAVKYEVISESEEEENELKAEMKNEVKQFFRGAVKKDLLAGKNLVKFLTANKNMSDATLNEMRWFLRDSMLYAVKKDKTLFSASEESETKIRFAESVKTADISKILKRMEQLEDRIKANANVEMSWQFLLGCILDTMK